MKRIALVSALLGLTAVVWSGLAQGTAFSFDDPKGVNSVIWSVDSLVEPMNGIFGGISGDITFNPDQPGATRGTITIDANSVQTRNERLTGGIKSGRFLNTEQHKTITFKITGVKDVKRDGNRFRGMVEGDLTMRGVTKPISAPSSLTWVPKGMETRSGGKGNVVVVRSTVLVNRREFGMTDVPSEVLGDEIEIRIAMTGVPKP